MPVKLDKRCYYTIASIMKLIEGDKFDLNPEYQRSDLIWAEKKQQRLIDSILKDLSIGSLFLRKKEERIEVLDGQQRLKTIKRFINNEFPTSPDFTPEFPNKEFRDLENETDRFALFKAFKVNYTQVLKGNESEVSDIFLRLQEGTPLNTAEKLNAHLGEMREFVIKSVSHPLYNLTKISKYRFSHRHIAAQIALLELRMDFKKISFPNLRIDDLIEIYCKYKLKIPPKLHRNIFGTYDLIHRSLKEDLRVLRKKTDLPIFYVFVSYLRKNYAVNFDSFATSFRKFSTNFFVNVERANITGDPKDKYVKYKQARRRGMTIDALTDKFDLLLQSFLSEVPYMRLKDEKRDFDYGQKLAVFYMKYNKFCQYCKNEVTWEQSSYHHIISYSKGGPTTVDNCQLMHKRCHDEFHREKSE